MAFIASLCFYRCRLLSMNVRLCLRFFLLFLEYFKRSQRRERNKGAHEHINKAGKGECVWKKKRKMVKEWIEKSGRWQFSVASNGEEFGVDSMAQDSMCATSNISRINCSFLFCPMHFAATSGDWDQIEQWQIGFNAHILLKNTF